MTPFAALSAVLGAALLGTAGWLATIVADVRYGGVRDSTDGPSPVALPRWLFVAIPACIGIRVGLLGLQPITVAIVLLAVVALTVCAVTDARSGVLPDLFTLGPLLVVLAIAAMRRELEPLWGALFAFVPFAALAVASRGRGMGWGDVKLAALGGALVGMGGIALAVVLASAAAFAVGVTGGRARRPIAFGPYLAASIGASLALGTVV